MKKYTSLISCLFLASTLYATNEISLKTLNNEKQKIGYAFGVIQAQSLNKSFPEFEKTFDITAFVNGIYDMLKTGKCKYDDAKLTKLMSLIRQKMVAKKEKKIALSFTNKSEISYAFACSGSKRIRPMLKGILDETALTQGLRDSLKNQTLLLKKSDIQKMMSKLKAEIAKNQAKTGTPKEAISALDKKNLKDGQDFLTKNKNQKGTVVLPNGLQYQIITKGTGKKPSISDKVEVHYKGSLIDGEVFDSSYKRGKPAIFGVTQVIKGWTDILQMMPVGSKWKVFIPYNLAYGERGSRPTILPFSTLIFDIELISIK